MTDLTIYHYTAFSSDPTKGNLAGIVLDADALSKQQMQEIAYQVGYNETTFVCRSERADLRLRYFTPGHEMDLCGHATIATFYALKTRAMLGTPGFDGSFLLETLAGLLLIEVKDVEGSITVWMKQAPADLRPFTGSLETLACVLGIGPEDIDTALPVVYGSTGVWTLLVPIRTLDAFQRMTPDNQRFPALLQDFPRASIHPFCLETIDPEAHMHARHFSSPFSGTIEDPVTGTASGAMGAYYSKYIGKYIEPKAQTRLLIEQGFEVGRDGRVLVEVTRESEHIAVHIAGTAVYSKTTILPVSEE